MATILAPLATWFQEKPSLDDCQTRFWVVKATMVCEEGRDEHAVSPTTDDLPN